MTFGLTRRQAISQLVQSNPELSQRAILSQLRSQGFAISNRAGRAIVNESRIEIARAADELNNLVNRVASETFRGFLDDVDFAEFTLREVDLRGRSDAVIERVLRENIRNREVFFKDRIAAQRGVRVSDFTHVVVTFIARALFTTYIQGRIYDSSREQIEAVFTTEVTAFTEELLAERVRQVAIGQFTQQFGQVSGIGAGSVIQGLRVEMTQLDITITSISPRGRRGRTPDSGRRGSHLATI